MVVGAIIIILGVLFTLENVGVIPDAGRYLRYWPAAVIAIGLIKFINPTHKGERSGGIILAVVGSLLLLWTLDVMTFNIWNLWPLMLVIFGARMLFGSQRQRGHYWQMHRERTAEPFFQQFVFMSGTHQQHTTTEFRGGDITAIMGGTHVDLRQAQMSGDSAVISIFAFWGGVEIRVPDTWNVELQGTPIMGGFDIKTLPQNNPEAKHLIIRGYAIMGGVEVKN
jgi:predicted membrane protein